MISILLVIMMYPFLALLILSPLMPFTTEEITGAPMKQPKVLTKQMETAFLFYLFHVLLFQKHQQ